MSKRQTSKTKNQVPIHPDDLKKIESRFIQAWHRAKSGDDVRENHVAVAGRPNVHPDPKKSNQELASSRVNS
jgi:hypothetical protein